MKKCFLVVTLFLWKKRLFGDIIKASRLKGGVRWQGVEEQML